jgi:tetratricopeptide (TPR) repeat protein
LSGKFSVRGSLVGFPWPLQFANALQYFVQYLRLLFWPARLSSDYSYDQYPAHISIWHWDIGLGALLLLMIVVVMLVSIRRAPPVAFGLAFFLVTFLPVSNFIIPILIVLSERGLYLPSLGIVLIVAWVMSRALHRRPNLRWVHPTVYGLAAVLIVLCTVRTVARNRDWKDEVTLFTTAVRAGPNCGNCWNCLGDALSGVGRYDEAIAAYNRSLEIMPDNGGFHLRKANTMLQAGRIEEAIAAFKATVQHAPEFGIASDQLARIYAGRGEFDEALKWALQAVSTEPGVAMFNYNLGYIFQRKGNLKEAMRLYRHAATLNPAEPSYLFNLGIVQQSTGDLDGALASFYKAVELSPDNEKYWMTLSDALLKKGALPAAAKALGQFILVSTNATTVAKAKGILDQIRKDTPR